MLARIYKPAKNAMQSGKGRTRNWVLEYEAEEARRIEPLMGYTGTGDMGAQIKLTFETQEEAVAYAERHGIAYQVLAPKVRKPVIRVYADNFKFGRIGQWTH